MERNPTQTIDTIVHVKSYKDLDLQAWHNLLAQLELTQSQWAKL